MRSTLGQRLRSVGPAADGTVERVGSEGSDGFEGDETGAGESGVDRERRADRTFDERADERPDGSPDPDAPRHVVCVVVDALRSDAVDLEVAPFLDDVVDVAAISPSTWTFPAVTSLLSGTYPHRHGAMRTADDFTDSVADVTPLPRPTDGNLLPDALARAGYATYGAFGFVVPFLALEGHFSTHRLYDDAPADRLLTDHAEWLADHRDEPTFSYLHLADLHEPVDPPADYWDAHEVDPEIPGISAWRHEDVVESTPTVERYRDHRRRLYRAAVEYVDNRLAAHRRRVVDVVEEVPAYVATADHGEGFWERAGLHAEHFADPRPAYCVGHGGAPYEPVVRVPLGVEGFDVDVSRDRRTSLVDVAPTLAEAVGVDIGGPAASGPIDAVPLSEAAPGDRRVLVEGARYGYEKKAVYGDGHKLIASRGDDVTVALSLPEETPLDLPGTVEESLLDVLPAWPSEGAGRKTSGGEGGDEAEGSVDQSARSEDRSVSPDVEERLERLGYR